MADKNLQETKTPVEVAKVTPKTEEGKPTQGEVKPTVGKTFTQEDMDRAVGKSGASLQQQITLSKTQAEAAEARATKLEGELDSLMTEKFADDSDGLASYRRKQELAKMARDIDTKRAELVKTEWAIGMYNKAREFNADTGIPVSELESCKDEAEMAKKAITWLKEQGKPGPEAKEPPPTIDSGVSTAGGPSWQDLSPDEKIRRGTQDMKI